MIFILIHISESMMFESQVQIIERDRERVRLQKIELELDYEDMRSDMFDNQIDIQKSNVDKKQYEFDVQIELVSRQIQIMKQQLEYHNVKINHDLLDSSMIMNHYDKYDTQCPICFKKFKDQYFVLVHLIRIHFDDYLKMNYKNDFVLVQSLCEFMYCHRTTKDTQLDRVEISKRLNKCSVFMQKLSDQPSSTTDHVCYDIVFDDLKVNYNENYVLMTLVAWIKYIFYYLVIVGIIIYYYAVFGFYKRTEKNHNYENEYSYSSDSD